MNGESANYRTPSSDPIEARITAAINRGISKRGLTYKEFAEEIGVRPALVWRWRNGKTLPSALLIPRIADALFEGDVNKLYGRSVEHYTTTMEVK